MRNEYLLSTMHYNLDSLSVSHLFSIIVIKIGHYIFQLICCESLYYFIALTTDRISGPLSKLASFFYGLLFLENHIYIQQYNLFRFINPDQGPPGRLITGSSIIDLHRTSHSPRTHLITLTNTLNTLRSIVFKNWR